MANIYDVSRLARVSVATVSAVVNESAYVSPALKARVQAAIAKLGYQPNLLARSLAKQKSHMLGMIVPDIANPFWPEVVRGAEDRAHTAGYTLLLANTDDDLRKEELYLDLFLVEAGRRHPVHQGARQAEPAGPRLASSGRARRSSRCRGSSAGFQADAVLMDDKDAAYEGVSHLLRLGYQRVGMIAGLQRRHADASAACRDTRRRSRTGSGRSIGRCSFRATTASASGYDAGLALLKRKMDAVFISNYVMAVGFMKALRQYQLRCPQDVAIVTCDDHTWMDSFSPRLTTVNFPKYELGAEAARVLLERLEDGEAPASDGAAQERAVHP